MSSLQVQERSWFYRNTANFVTVARLLMASGLVCLAIWRPEQIILMCLLAVWCALSDILDGYLARRMRIISRAGESLDCLADKMFICSLIIFIAWGYSLGDDIPRWLKTLTQGVVGAIIFLESVLMLSGVWGSLKGKKVCSNKFGKIKMVMESIAVIFWFACLVIGRGRLSSWPLIAMDIILVLSIFYALKSMKDYCKDFFGAD